MVKQALSRTCICGQTMSFPEGQIKAKCLTENCGANWELGAEGFWAITHIDAAQQMDEAVKEFIESMKVAFKRVFTAIMTAAEDINPKWLHYYSHSKKQRIRNKYEKMIRIYLTNSLQPLQRGKVGKFLE